jgi:TatD DNase family protein
MLIDTHCHLDFPDFDGQREEIIARAEAEGVRFILSPGTSIESSKEVVEFADRFENVFAAVGVHPNYGEDWDESSIDELANLAQHPKVVAIGEIGLDYHHKKFPKEKQNEILLAQLDLAAELELPVIIHNRKSDNDIMRIMTSWQSDLEARSSSLAARPGVLHSFSGDLSIAEKAIEHNLIIGLAGPITFRNAPEAQLLASQIQLENIVIETDSPFLSPHPFRGKRNEPARVKMVAERLAELKDMSFEKIAEVTSRNALSLFKLELAVR